MTIYDDIGGAGAVGAAVDGFCERVLADERLARHFEGVDRERLKGHQRSFLAAAIGGPDGYLGLAMGDAHAHLDISREDVDAVLGHLGAALRHLDVDADVVDAVVSALRPLGDEIVDSGPGRRRSAADPGHHHDRTDQQPAVANGERCSHVSSEAHAVGSFCTQPL